MRVRSRKTLGIRQLAAWMIWCRAKGWRRRSLALPFESDVNLSGLQVIEDICKRMGDGMAEFIPIEVTTTAQYEKCVRTLVAFLSALGIEQSTVGTAFVSVASYESHCCPSRVPCRIEARNVANLTYDLGPSCVCIAIRFGPGAADCGSIMNHLFNSASLRVLS